MLWYHNCLYIVIYYYQFKVQAKIFSSFLVFGLKNLIILNRRKNYRPKKKNRRKNYNLKNFLPANQMLQTIDCKQLYMQIHVDKSRQQAFILCTNFINPKASSSQPRLKVTGMWIINHTSKFRDENNLATALNLELILRTAWGRNKFYEMQSFDKK